MENTHKNAIVVDTNVLIHDPNSIEVLLNDTNIVFIHSTVLLELDSLKRKLDIGSDCREVINLIEELHKNNHPRLIISNDLDFSKLPHLDKNCPDHRIICLAYNLTKKDNEFDKVKLVSNDTMVRILARDLGILVEDYQKTKVKLKDNDTKVVNVPKDIISFNTFTLDNMDDFIENEGVICMSDYSQDNDNSFEWAKRFTAIKKYDKFVITPNDISVMGLKSYSMYANSRNFEQEIAMHHLLDKDISLSFLIGGSGSGKTLLSLASALDMRRYYRNILITRPMVHLEDENNMGYLPGDVKEKMSPWMKPITRTLSYISGLSDDNKTLIEKLRENGKIDFEPLDYIRGNTFLKDLIIVDEAQNLSAHQVKSIITRAGDGTKIIFTGDLGQIDRNKKLSKASSGLAYASEKLKNNMITSCIHLKETVRSRLAKLADKML